MRIFKTRWLGRYARRQRIADDSLQEAVERAAQGLIDADLGGGLYQATGRAQRAGALRRLSYAGRLSGGRPRGVSLRVCQNDRDNIDADELLTFREIGTAWLKADTRTIAQALEDGRLQEVPNEQDDETA